MSTRENLLAPPGLRCGRPTFRIASNSSLGGGNPYLDLFYGALAQHGIEFAGVFKPTPRWLRENGPGIDALHFHWPEYLLRRVPDWARSLTGFPGNWRVRRLVRRLWPPVCLAELRGFLRAASTAGKRIVWTVHNVEPHEHRSHIQEAGFRALAKSADLLICHDSSAQWECLRRYPGQWEIVVMPHGNYDGTYPLPRSRAEVLRELGLNPDVQVVCCLGGIGHYKGVDLAVEAVRRLSGKVQLVIAGRPRAGFDLERLQSQVAGIPWICLKAELLSKQKFADVLGASDAALLPYRSVTGSGALLCALTFARGVVASDLAYFRSVLHGHPDAGVLFRAEDVGALAQAIEQYLRVPSRQRSAAARTLADEYAWPRVIRPLVGVIERWRSNGVGSPTAEPDG